MRDDQDDLPMSFRLQSDDMPDVHLPAFYTHIPVDAVVDSATWGRDNPQALQARGPMAVGRAFVRMALGSQISVHQDVRELAALLLEHFGDGLLHDRLALDLGLVPRNGAPSLALLAKQAERKRLLAELSRSGEWASMGPWRCAKAMRLAYLDYIRNRWPGHVTRRARPTGEDATWWQIRRLGLPKNSLPKERALAALIAESR